MASKYKCPQVGDIVRHVGEDDCRLNGIEGEVLAIKVGPAGAQVRVAFKPTLVTSPGEPQRVWPHQLKVIRAYTKAYR